MTQLSTGINDDKTQLLKKDQLNIDKSEIAEVMFSNLAGARGSGGEGARSKINSCKP